MRNGRGGRVALLGALVVVLVAVAACSPPTGGGGGPATSWIVDPADTDPALSSDLLAPNLAHLPTGTEVGQLVVIFAGTSAGTRNFAELSNVLRAAGRHVVVLRYNNAVGTLSACPDSGAATDPDCFRTFRAEVTFGEGVDDPESESYDHPLVSVSAAESVVNRLLKLLDRLEVIAPDSGWEQFRLQTAGSCDQLNTTYGSCEADWSKISVAGHSQGAGVGLYLSKFFALERLAMLSGAFDAHALGGGSFQPAPWITEAPLAVDPSDITTFFHAFDPDLQRIRAVADAVGVPGSEVSVQSSSPPYGGTNRLLTSAGSSCPFDPSGFHNSTAVDICVPDGAYVDAWTHLLVS